VEHFINDVVKPWDELNRLLARPFAYRPDVSDVTRLANAIAVALKHTAEHMGVGRGATDRASPGNMLMSDVADAWKHGGKKLDDPARHNEMAVLSRFEVSDDGEFRFLRNRIVIQHATVGNVDFMVNARNAIRYWLAKLNLHINWSGSLLEGPAVFGHVAVIYYDASQQLGMGSVRIETVRRADTGTVYAFDAPDVKWAMVDFHEDSFAQLGEPVVGAD